jgi:hypothetical protein
MDGSIDRLRACVRAWVSACVRVANSKQNDLPILSRLRLRRFGQALFEPRDCEATSGLTRLDPRGPRSRVDSTSRSTRKPEAEHPAVEQRDHGLAVPIDQQAARERLAGQLVAPEPDGRAVVGL